MRVLTAVMFSPRGGSAHAARALARGLRSAGHDVTLLAGSRSDLGPDADARCFYGDVQPVDFGPALASPDPIRYEGPTGTAPMHPSFEDRRDAADVVFAALDDADFERQVDAWGRALQRAGAPDADVIHLHHLTPLNEATARVAPRVPVVGQLHGTELLMLEQIASGPPREWRYAERWAARMRRWAQACRLLVIAPGGTERAIDVLGVERDRLVELPGGVDVETFRPLQIDRRGLWRRVLIDAPAPDVEAYEPAAVERLAAATTLLYVGRFTAVKRLDRLLEAYAEARRRTRSPCALVLVGGHPGEYEGEHPADMAARLGVEDMFLAGWHPQSELPEFLGAGDVLVLSSEREQFGLVVVEAMACGVPPVATRSLGPELIIDDGATGWLVEPPGLADALVEAIDDPEERGRRARRAREVASARYAWTRIAARLGELLCSAVDQPAVRTGEI